MDVMPATVISGAKVFDGERVVNVPHVILERGVVAGLGGPIPADAEAVEGAGCTLLPGLIDAHVHTSPASLALALRFGVTTELEMQGVHTRANRGQISSDDAVADVRSSGFAITPPGGHPSELFPKDSRPGGRPAGGGGGGQGGAPPYMPFSTTPQEAAAHIPKLIESGSDYIKFMVDDGTVEGSPVPMLDQATLDAGVAAAKRCGMLTVAHALTIEATRMCARAGIDGLMHVFMDQPHTEEIITTVAEADMFVVPCVVLNASMMGITGAELADDPRVAGRLSNEWESTLRSSFNHYPQGRIEDVLTTVVALDRAGVKILVGTDSSAPLPFLGGVAHGASVHHEMQYLVRAGLPPLQALSAATAATADCLGLGDRGRIAPGKRADLLLVAGDPTNDISDTLNTRAVWRRGVRLTESTPAP